MAPSNFGAWLSYAGYQHAAALAFFLADIFLLSGVGALTCVQASQVYLTVSFFVCLMFFLIVSCAFF